MEKRTEPVPSEMLQRNLKRVREHISAAALKAGRNTNDIKLVAVTKYVGVAEIKALLEVGVTCMGEARIQDAEKKIRELAGASAQWHLIGHLQTNKADKAIRLFQTIHSIDSLKVAQALDKEIREARFAHQVS